MDQKTFEDLAEMWQVDKDELFDLWQNVTGLIKNSGVEHPDCLLVHVATLIAADYLTSHHARAATEAGVEVANVRLVAAMHALGHNVAALVDASVETTPRGPIN